MRNRDLIGNIVTLIRITEDYYPDKWLTKNHTLNQQKHSWRLYWKHKTKYTAYIVPTSCKQSRQSAADDHPPKALRALSTYPFSN
jgi:hypothetical protein